MSMFSKCEGFNSNLYRVIHKSVKHFKNSQQIDYATDHVILTSMERETV